MLKVSILLGLRQLARIVPKLGNLVHVEFKNAAACYDTILPETIVMGFGKGKYESTEPGMKARLVVYENHTLPIYLSLRSLASSLYKIRRLCTNDIF